jgi:diacylglycerol kinase family enzyme
MHALVLHNPSAGAGGVKRRELTRVLNDAGIEAIFISTKAEELADTMFDLARYDLVIAAGGDGTVAKAIKHVGNRGAPIAILPLGGSNNIARSFGLARAWQDIPARWAKGRKKKLNVGAAEGPWGISHFIEGCGLGGLARVASQVPNEIDPAIKIQKGRNALRKFLQEAEPDPVTLTVDGKKSKVDMLMFEALNTPFVGPSLHLAEADPGDGKLDVIVVTAEHRAAMDSWIVEPHDPPPPDIFHKRGRRLEFEWSRIGLHIDDRMPKPPKKPQKVVIEMCREPVTVLLPQPERKP